MAICLGTTCSSELTYVFLSVSEPVSEAIKLFPCSVFQGS